MTQFIFRGDAFYTANFLATLMGVDTHSLTQAVWFKGVSNYASKYPETLTAGGLQRGGLT